MSETAISNFISRSTCHLKRRNVILASFFLVISAVTYIGIIFDSKITIKHYVDYLKFHPWTSAAAFRHSSNGDVTAADCDLSSSYWDTVLNSDTLTGAQVMKYFKWSNRQSCQLVQDFGGTMYKKPSGWDGQKSLCLDPEVAPEPGDCLVYSFGTNDEWSFDEQMSAYGCQVFAFDPSMMGEDHYDHNPGNVHFYKWGLGDRDRHDTNYNWEIRSLSSIYQTLAARHGRKIIDYLKIDIEGSEWDVITEMIASGMLSNVRQLGVEIHLVINAPLEKYHGYAKLLRSMETMGMVRFDSEFNPWFMGNFTRLPELGKQSRGYEIAWFNANLTRHPTGG